jgi:hypothetical protein
MSGVNLHPDEGDEMSDEIRRFKSDEEMQTEDWIGFHETGERPDRSEYREARRQALERAGLETDDPPDPTLEEMSVDDHLTRQERNRI